MSSHEDDQATLEEDLAAVQAELEEGQDVEATAEEEVEEVEAVEEVEELEPIDPPHMWGKDYREIFNQWGELENGRTYQEAMANLWKETQGHVTKKEQEAAQYRHAVSQWNEMFTPMEQELQMRGTNPQALTKQLLGYYGVIQQNPIEGIARIAGDFGVSESDIREFLDGQPYVPPEVQGLQQQVQTVQQALDQQRQQAEAQQAKEVTQRIESFASETDASGNLLRPHLQAVENEMVQLIYGFRAANNERTPDMAELQSLYEKACRINDNVFSEVSQDKGVQEAARKAAQAKKAKTAAKRPSGKKSGNELSEKTLMEELKEVQSELAA